MTKELQVAHWIEYNFEMERLKYNFLVKHILICFNFNFERKENDHLSYRNTVITVVIKYMSTVQVSEFV